MLSLQIFLSQLFEVQEMPVDLIITVEVENQLRLLQMQVRTVLNSRVCVGQFVIVGHIT
jgi:hypothetical protein